MSEVEFARGALWPWLLALPVVWAALWLALDRARAAMARYGAAPLSSVPSPLWRSLRLTLLLGLVTTDEPPCGPLGSSVSTADFELDIDGEPTGKIRNGRIRVEYSGACLFPGDEALAGATVMFETFFEGQRTGPLSVPESLRSLPTYDENGQPF